MGKNKRKSLKASLYRIIANHQGLYELPKNRIPSIKEFIEKLENEKRGGKSATTCCEKANNLLAK